MYMYRLLPTTPTSSSGHYYPRLIVGTNLPTPKGWVAWLAKGDCTHITFAQGYYTIESKGTARKWTRLPGPRPTRYQWINCAVHKGPRNYSLNVLGDRGIEPHTLCTSGQWPNYWTAQASIYIYIYIYIYNIYIYTYIYTQSHIRTHARAHIHTVKLHAICQPTTECHASSLPATVGPSLYHETSTRSFKIPPWYWSTIFSATTVPLLIMSVW